MKDQLVNAGLDRLQVAGVVGGGLHGKVAVGHLGGDAGDLLHGAGQDLLAGAQGVAHTAHFVPADKGDRLAQVALAHGDHSPAGLLQGGHDGADQRDAHGAGRDHGNDHDHNGDNHGNCGGALLLLDGFIPVSGEGLSQLLRLNTHIVHSGYALVQHQVGAQSGIPRMECGSNVGNLLLPGCNGVGVVPGQTVAVGIQVQKLIQLFVQLRLVGGNFLVQFLDMLGVIGEQTHLPQVPGHAVGVVAGLAHQGVALYLSGDQAVELILHTALVEQAEDKNHHQRDHCDSEADEKTFLELHLFEIHDIFLLFSLVSLERRAFLFADGTPSKNNKISQCGRTCHCVRLP